MSALFQNTLETKKNEIKAAAPPTIFSSAPAPVSPTTGQNGNSIADLLRGSSNNNQRQESRDPSSGAMQGNSLGMNDDRRLSMSSEEES